MNVFAKFDEIPSMILQDIKETKRYRNKVGWMDNVKTVYPPANCPQTQFAGGKIKGDQFRRSKIFSKKLYIEII